MAKEWWLAAPLAEEKSKPEDWWLAAPLAKAEPDPNSIWTDAADLGKKLLGPFISQPLSAPLGVERGIKGSVRDALEGVPSSVMPSAIYQPGLDTEEDFLGPETPEEKGRRQLSAARSVASLPNIPGARALDEIGKSVQQSIDDSISQNTKKAIREGQLTGNMLVGEGSFGTNPTVRGFVMQVAGVLGSTLSSILLATTTKSPTAVGTLGFGMAAAEGADNAAEYIGKLSDEQLRANSPFYVSMIAGGADAKEARALTVEKAAESAAVLQGLVGAFGDVLTGKLVTGAFDDMLRKVGGKTVMGRTAAGVAVAAPEQGVQELTEGVAADPRY